MRVALPNAHQFLDRSFLAAGLLVFVGAWLSPDIGLGGWPSWVAHGAWIGALAWYLRRVYEPLCVIAVGSYVVVAWAASTAFRAVATSGGNTNVPEVYEAMRDAVLICAGIAVLGLARITLASPRRRGTVLGLAVIVTATWWASFFEEFALSCRHEGGLISGGRQHLALSLLGSGVLMGVVVQWLRSGGHRRSARYAASLSAVALLGMAVRSLNHPGPNGSRWNLPLSSTASPDTYPDYWWRLQVHADGQLVLDGDALDLEQFSEKLVNSKHFADHESLTIIPVAEARWAHLAPALRALINAVNEDEWIRLRCRGAVHRTWREVLSDSYPRLQVDRRMGLALTAAPAPERTVAAEIHGDGVCLAPSSGWGAEVDLVIDLDLTMQSVVEALDSLRSGGVEEIRLVVP